MMANSVGEIVTYDKSGNGLALGTCFVYSSDGQIITNYHVIDGAYSAEVTLAGNTYKVQKVLAYDKDIDIAVLQINASDLVAVEICKNEHKIGSSVYAFGSSQGLTATFSQGIITSNRELDNIMYVQHDAAISSGNSGGPLINAYGEVIGINTMTMKDSQNLNFAINISELDNLVYGNSLTMSEFYNVEFNPYEALKEWVLENYNNTGDSFISFYYRTSDDNYYALSIVYYLDADYLSISSFCVFDNNDARFITIELSEDPAKCWYRATYTDGNYGFENIVEGYINATAFTSISSLGYYSYKGDYWTKTSILETYQEAAVDVVDWFGWCLDYYNIGLTLSDFGFVKF